MCYGDGTDMKPTCYKFDPCDGAGGAFTHTCAGAVNGAGIGFHIIKATASPSRAKAQYEARCAKAPGSSRRVP